MPLRVSDDIRAAGTHRSGSSLPDPRASLRAEQRVRDERRGRLSDARCKYHHTIQADRNNSGFVYSTAVSLAVT